MDKEYREDKLDENNDECVRYYRMAADLNQVVALHNLGNKHQHDEDVEEIDFAAAVFYYEKAASLGYAESQLNLGYLLAIQKISSKQDSGYATFFL